MKKLSSFFVAYAVFVTSYATTTPSTTPLENPAPNVKTMMLPVGKTGNTISLMDLAHISVKDFQTLTRKKMSFFDKTGFKLGQKNVATRLKKTEPLRAKCCKSMRARWLPMAKPVFTWVVLPLDLLGLIGVLIAYLVNDEKKSNRVKWAWIGLGVIVVISLIAALA